jgi:hypothetical protein
MVFSARTSDHSPMDWNKVLRWALFAVCLYIAATVKIPLLPFTPLARP